MTELYPYRWTSARHYPRRFNQHCTIREYLQRGMIVVEFDDGFRLRAPRLTVRLRDAYKREEVAVG